MVMRVLVLVLVLVLVVERGAGAAPATFSFVVGLINVVPNGEDGGAKVLQSSWSQPGVFGVDPRWWGEGTVLHRNPKFNEVPFE